MRAPCHLGLHAPAGRRLGGLHWGLNTQQAIDLPNFASLNGPTLLEEKRFDAATISALKAIQRTLGGYFGSADPQREGVMLAD